MIVTKPAADPRPCVALLLGDMTGIGPEIAARVLADGRLADAARSVVVGDARVLAMGMRMRAWSSTDACVAATSPSEVDWSEPAGPDHRSRQHRSRQIRAREDVASSSGGSLARRSRRRSSWRRPGAFDAISFAPLNKQALHAGGWKFPDEHKMFAHLLRHNGYFSEMNVLDPCGCSASPPTSRCARRSTRSRRRASTQVDRAGDATMQKAGIAKPRIAVAALNPHGGEGGLFGREEIEMIRPTVEAVAARGIDCKGPFPADTIYLKASPASTTASSDVPRPGPDRDQAEGLRPRRDGDGRLETVSPRPAHGTAFDIVGEGKATTGALEAAVRLAAKLVARA